MPSDGSDVCKSEPCVSVEKKTAPNAESQPAKIIFPATKGQASHVETYGNGEEALADLYRRRDGLLDYVLFIRDTNTYIAQLASFALGTDKACWPDGAELVYVPMRIRSLTQSQPSQPLLPQPVAVDERSPLVCSSAILVSKTGEESPMSIETACMSPLDDDEENGKWDLDEFVPLRQARSSSTKTAWSQATSQTLTNGSTGIRSPPANDQPASSIAFRDRCILPGSSSPVSDSNVEEETSAISSSSPIAVGEDGLKTTISLKAIGRKSAAYIPIDATKTSLLEQIFMENETPSADNPPVGCAEAEPEAVMRVTASSRLPSRDRPRSRLGFYLDDIGSGLDARGSSDSSDESDQTAACRLPPRDLPPGAKALRSQPSRPNMRFVSSEMPGEARNAPPAWFRSGSAQMEGTNMPLLSGLRSRPAHDSPVRIVMDKDAPQMGTDNKQNQVKYRTFERAVKKRLPQPRFGRVAVFGEDSRGRERTRSNSQ